jgi:electron transfer flavoprotein alpha subunit
MSTDAAEAGGGSGAAAGAGADAGAARRLLAVVEPEADPARPVAGLLRAEAARVARLLGASVCCVTWPAGSAAGPVARALAALVREDPPLAVLLLDTDLGREVAPLLAHLTGSGAVLGCSDVRVRPGRDGVSRPVFVKPVHGGWLEREVEAAGSAVPVVALAAAGLEPSIVGEALPAAGLLELPGDAASDVRHLETLPPESRSVDLVYARRIVTAGQGVRSAALLDAVRELADLLDGSVGATRPMTDDRRLPKERLIGQTGRSVTPELYLALGVSGSPHHMAGVLSADRVLAINRDVRAPVFQYSDEGYVADLDEVLPALVARIKEWRDEPAPG